jgi:hypothetical protein
MVLSREAAHEKRTKDTEQLSLVTVGWHHHLN